MPSFSLPFMIGLSLAYRSRWSTVTGVFVALVLLAGFGLQDAYARCGQGNSRVAWKYASTAELIRWDGRWSFDVWSGSGMLDESHADPDAKTCSRCGGRPTDENPEPTPATIVRVDSQTFVFASQTFPADQNTPPLPGILLANDFLSTRSLEVAKRPPKNLPVFAV